MVSTIFQYGEDALNNEFSVKIALPTFLQTSNLDGMLTFSATGVRIPAYSIKTFTQSFRGYEIERWKPGTDTSRDLSLTFRIDKYWRVYDTLLDWAKQVVNLEDGTYFGDTYLTQGGSDIEQVMRRVANMEGDFNLRGSLYVYQDNVSGDTLSEGWTFKGVWPKSIEEVSFDARSSGDVVNLGVTFSYITCRRGI